MPNRFSIALRIVPTYNHPLTLAFGAHHWKPQVVSHPSTFGRPQSANDIGKGISTAASMASLLNWDTDGDGDIDMDELARGVGAMGFRMKKKEKSVFKQASAERGYI